MELITSTRYCPTHTRETWGNSRTSTPEHRARRIRVLTRDNHQCQIRYTDICISTATHCDHIDNITAGGQDTDDNCQAACEPCHRRKTAIEGNRAQGNRIRG